MAGLVRGKMSYDPLLDAPSDLVGAFSGDHKCDEEGVSIALLLTTLAAIAVAFFVLLTTITMGNGRKKREAEENGQERKERVLNSYYDYFIYGTLATKNGFGCFILK